MVLINQIKPKHQPRAKRRIGRGGKRGTYSGKGQKGQKSRAGAKFYSEQRAAILKIPKRRGVGVKNSPQKFKHFSVSVNLDSLEKIFKSGETVALKWLLSRKLVNKLSGKLPLVKVLAGSKKFGKKLYFVGIELSAKAKEAIIAAGGAVR